MRWLIGFLERIGGQECRVCGGSLRDARTVVERERDGGMTAVLYCRVCRARNTAHASRVAA